MNAAIHYTVNAALIAGNHDNLDATCDGGIQYSTQQTSYNMQHTAESIQYSAAYSPLHEMHRTAQCMQFSKQHSECSTVLNIHSVTQYKGTA